MQKCPKLFLTIIDGDASPFPKDVSLREVSMLRNLQDYVVTLLRDRDRANAVEHALIMALVAVFIIAGVIAMSGASGAPFNSAAACLGDAVNCNTATF